ncbi:hypothetical protein MACH15_26370 [Maricaulis maris]|nr:hypothetical protein MACH15_26370 [Maricaulis maris]
MSANLGAMTGRGKALCRTRAARHGIVTARERGGQADERPDRHSDGRFPLSPRRADRETVKSPDSE